MSVEKSSGNVFKDIGFGDAEVCTLTAIADTAITNQVPALVENLAMRILARDNTIEIQTAALTTALKELGRRHDGSKECTETIKQIGKALERVTG